jgi:predicted nucleotidyltransferase
LEDHEGSDMDWEQLKIELAAIFVKYGKDIIAAYLFGSTAKGLTSSSSDIDIALLLHSNDKTSGAALKFSLYTDLCRTLKRNDIDVMLLNLSGNLILSDEIIRHGKALYSTDDEAREEFELKVLHRCIDFKSQRHFAMGV